MTQTCNCNAYKFPHREGGGRCNEPEYIPVTSYSEGEEYYNKIRHENAVYAAKER